MASISLRGIVKRYGSGPKATAVIHGLDAEIGEGEFVVIVGPSGCGKSTLLRMVAGLEEVTDGQIVFRTAAGERVVNDVEPAARDIAMVFQNYALYPHMSVYDNMAYGLKIAKVPKDEIRQRVEKAARILELGGLLERRPRQLSGGQRQRVAMGRAIVRQPQVFLFDEPLSNLDAKLRAQTRLEIQKLHAELGVTSLFVTHDQVEAMTLAQRMIVMNGGRMEQFGTPEAVYARPATTFVASFIGSPPMNLLAGERAARATFVTAEGVRLALPPAAATPGEGAGILGVRPEHLGVDHGEVAAGEARWRLHVEVVEMLGAERLVHGRLGDVDGAAAPASVVQATAPGSLFTVRLDASEHSPRAGDVLPLRILADRLHWFDPATQRRLDD
jgi:sn-glycerol 3-phosphate transport system ATP-binding protein